MLVDIVVSEVEGADGNVVAWRCDLPWFRLGGGVNSFARDGGRGGDCQVSKLIFAAMLVWSGRKIMPVSCSAVRSHPLNWSCEAHRIFSGY